MKISELLDLRDRLKTAYDTLQLMYQLDFLKNNLKQVSHDVTEAPYQQLLETVLNDFKLMDDNLANSELHLIDLLDAVKAQIEEEEVKFFGENYRLELKQNAIESIRNIRKMKLSDDTDQEVHARINRYTSWEYPALEIGCRDGDWTKHLVAGDPLYIADMYQEFLDSAVSQFPEEYQRRTRLYQYKDPADLVNMLPKNQFGFVFCWNFMNYASFDTIKEYLKAVKVLLRPGGTFMFSYNDGDRPGGAGMAENFFMTYTPKRMLVPLAESLGYIVTEQCDRDRTVSWVELRNPGELKTVKAHQVLGEINRINN